MARKPTSATKPPRDTETIVIDAALALAAERSWHDLALADIAAAAGIGLIDLYRTFRSKPAILGALSRRIDAATIDLPAEADASAQERLFEVLMHRFDLLTPYKPGLKGLARDARRGRLDGLALACHLPRSLAWMLEAWSDDPITAARAFAMFVSTVDSSLTYPFTEATRFGIRSSRRC